MRRVLRDPSVRKASRIRPLLSSTCLRLPRPLYPAGTGLIRARLCLPELAKERLVLATEPTRGPGPAVARADICATWVRAVVARADAAPVQVLRAVRDCGAPLAHDRPQVEATHVRRLATRGGDVLGLGHCDVRVGEDLIDVSIHCDALPLGRIHVA